jgi:polar amino acid transport system substrate-binding protein
MVCAVQRHLPISIVWRVLRSVIFPALLAIGCHSAFAADCPNHPLVVGMYEFGGFYSNGSGLDLDIVNELARRSGCRFVVKVLNRENIWIGMQNGSIDMTLSAAAIKERLTFARAYPYFMMRNYVVFNSKVKPTVRSAEDVIADPALRLGAVEGFYVGNNYDSFVTSLRNIGRVDNIENVERLFLMLKANRFQVVISTPMVFYAYLKNESYRYEDWYPESAKTTGNLLISKRTLTEADADRIGKLVQAIATDGTFAKLIRKYVDEQLAQQMMLP